MELASGHNPMRERVEELLISYKELELCCTHNVHGRLTRCIYSYIQLLTAHKGKRGGEEGLTCI